MNNPMLLICIILVNLIVSCFMFLSIDNKINEKNHELLEMILNFSKDINSINGKNADIQRTFISIMNNNYDIQKQIVSDLKDALKQIDTLQDQLQELQSWRNSEEIIINKPIPFDRSVLDDLFYDPLRTMPTITCEEAQDA